VVWFDVAVGWGSPNVGKGHTLKGVVVIGLLVRGAYTGTVLSDYVI